MEYRAIGQNRAYTSFEGLARALGHYSLEGIVNIRDDVGVENIWDTITPVFCITAPSCAYA
jgi:hypothetical protein